MTTTKRIVITTQDYDRLETLLFSLFTAAFDDKLYLQSLRGELARAEVIDAKKMPPDVVTMNSTVRLLDLADQEVETYTLVYPHDANIADGKLSVLAPIGTAILGYQVGDLVQWQVPSGTASLRIEELIYQPERDEVAVTSSR